MSFKDRSFESRFAAMGDEAEGVFEKAWAGGWARFGLNRPPIGMKRLSPFVRYKPDYITTHYLVEVQGFGKDQTIKVKLEKAQALDEWHRHHAVQIFLWDTTNREYGLADWPDMHEALHLHATLECFPEGKRYWALAKERAPVETWVPHGE